MQSSKLAEGDVFPPFFKMATIEIQETLTINVFKESLSQYFVVSNKKV